VQHYSRYIYKDSQKLKELITLLSIIFFQHSHHICLKFNMKIEFKICWYLWYVQFLL